MCNPEYGELYKQMSTNIEKITEHRSAKEYKYKREKSQKNWSSYRYTTIQIFRKFEKVSFISYQKAAVILVRLKNITVYSKNL